jgi:UDP-glucuronate 4-epimerase
MRVVVTGAAGFIGSVCAAMLLDRGDEVLGLDNINDYYSTALKHDRLEKLEGREGFSFVKLDLADVEKTTSTIVEWQPEVIIHLAAQAGVRASAERPFDYVYSNLVGHMVVLEATRKLPDLRQLVYASSSSVYGNRNDGAFKETDRVDAPQSLYAATKRADELMTAVYCDAYGLSATGLRFFTVYGPKGRPDMAYWTFAERMLDGLPITAYDGGRLKRDFTFVNDIVSGILTVADNPPQSGQHRLYNIGNNEPQPVSALISALETSLGVKAVIIDAPKPSYDVETTYANIDAMQKDFGWRPTTTLSDGIAAFATWFLEWRVVQARNTAPEPVLET